MRLRCQNIRRGKRCWRVATMTHELTGLRGCRRCVLGAESTSVFGYPISPYRTEPGVEWESDLDPTKHLPPETKEPEPG